VSGEVPVPARPAGHLGWAPATGLVRDGGLWREIRVVTETGSTNADLAAAARAGAPEGSVLVAEVQRAGRGRLDRRWVSPPGAGLTFSVLLRPGPAVPVARWGWLPLLAGVAVHRAISRLTGLDAAVKWPNDVLLGPTRRKVAGLLAEASGDAVVLGVGINVTTAAADLPDGATSLAAEGAADADRGRLLRAVLERLADDYLAWRGAGGHAAGCGLRAAYLAACATLGSRVRVTEPGGGVVQGVAGTVDEAGRLVLRTAAGERAISAGDVVHVRPAPDPGA
jgi:BirA family transcriptional regulator, biotin operon repressor / biotin---[acetyl-CoA-carboxylase] ligase